jgi:hypothetical protein
MKCANCGKEFGSGTNCQNCGIDRVSGLANYSGYNPSIGSNTNQRHKSQQDSFSTNGGYSYSNTMICYACEEIIPANSEYCPHCRKKLFETCPKCGAKYSSQYRVCNKCGTDRYEYSKEMQAREKEERKRQLEDARKKQAQEREEQYKWEAQYLREKLPPSVASVSTVLISAWILFCLTPFWPFYGYGNLLVIIGVSILLWGISAMICGAIGESKIKNWKEEHPNDPRCKYL